MLTGSGRSEAEWDLDIAPPEKFGIPDNLHAVLCFLKRVSQGGRRNHVPSISEVNVM